MSYLKAWPGLESNRWRRLHYVDNTYDVTEVKQESTVAGKLFMLFEFFCLETICSDEF